MADLAADRNPIDLLAEEFAERYRRGERPSLTEYVEKHPDLAEEIRDLFPALVMMENLKPATADVTGGYEPVAASGGKKLEHLGDYRILREVGRGGMGIVYEAEQVSLGRHVALKVLPAHALLDPQHLQRFHREARAAARLHHTNIVPVYGVGEADGLHYYVMQFIHGHGLDQVISELRRLHHQGPAIAVQPNPASESALRLMTGLFAAASTDHVPGRPAPEISDTSAVSRSGIHLPGESDTSSLTGASRQYWNSVARIGIQVADALAYAGSQGILHRDVKPSNLLLDTQGIVWITDFGLAKADTDHDNLTHTGDIVGTLRFMAPERFNGQSDVRSDLYALGLTLYELLTLRPAFDETNRNKLVEQVMFGQPLRPRKINAGVPRDLETIVLKCIDRQPHKRYQSAAELAEDLRRFVDDKPIRARRVSETEKFWLWCKRNPAMACLLAALVLVFLGGFAGVAWKWREAVAEREAKDIQRQVAETERDRASREETNAKKEWKRAENALYHNQIARARLEYQANNVRGATHLLDLCATDRRGWEWHFLDGLCHAELFTLGGHSAWVNAVAYSPDGKLMATAGGGNPYLGNPGQEPKPGEVILRDAATGKVIQVLQDHKEMVRGIAFSADGRWLASASQDGTVRLRDVAKRDTVRVLPANRALFSICFRPDGRRIAAGCVDGSVRFWDVATGNAEPPLKVGAKLVCSVRYSPDSQWLATSDMSMSGGEVRLWSAATLTPAAALEGNQTEQGEVAFSPDSRTLAAGAYTGITLWDLPSGKLRRILSGHNSSVHGVAFSSDGLLLASAGVDSTVRVWNIHAGIEKQVFRGHVNITNAVAFNPVGDRLLSGSDDGTARVWDLTTDRELNVVADQGWLNDREANGWRANVEAIGYAEGGREIVLVQRGGGYWRLDSRTYTCLQRGRVGAFDEWVTPAEPMCIDGAGRYLAGIAIGNDRVVKCWDLRSGKERSTLRGHEEPIKYVTISADGGRIAAAPATPPKFPSLRAEVRVWDGANGDVLFDLREAGWVAGRMALGPQGERLAVTGMRRATGSEAAAQQTELFVKVYDVATRQQLQEYTGFEGFLGGALAFSPDGRRLAVADMRGNVRIWDVTSGDPLVTSQAGPVAAMDLAFSPDGQRLLIASRGMTKLLDTATGDELLVLRGLVQKELNRNGFNPRARFSPDGKRILSLCHDSPYGLSQWSIEEETPEVRPGAAERRSVVGRLRLAADLSYAPQSAFFRHAYGSLRDAPVVGAWEHLARGHLHVVAGEGDRAEADISSALRLAGDDSDALTACGDALAARGRWADAAAAFADVLAREPDHFLARCGAADVCLHQGDRKGQEAHARELLRRFGDTEDPLLARGVVRRLLGMPGLPTDAALVPRLAERVARVGSRDGDPGYLLWANGLADLRGGRFDRAVERLAQTLPRFNTDPTKAARAEVLFFLAVALHHLHHPEAARARLAEGAALFEELGPAGKPGAIGDYWSDWAYARAAAAEAKTAIGGKEGPR